MRLSRDSDCKSEGGMRKSAMRLQFLLGSDHNVRATAAGSRTEQGATWGKLVGHAL